MSSTVTRTQAAFVPAEAGAARLAAPRAALRLTRRGRAAVLLALVALLLGAFAAGRTASQASQEPEQRSVLSQTTVQRGESLWTVARRVAPEQDPRQVVVALRRLNSLPTAQVQAGQQLLLPAAA
ncbi:MAG: LysM peptidoglycan-binding domain-containing protein [Actinomycetota bacterium]|nr:LysM peptidoglycan-binding domain-containing protein [Actinomycetota bacterium]